MKYTIRLLSTKPCKDVLLENMSQIQLKARDNARTPFPWANAAHGGFTNCSEPWMRANPDYETCNAATQVGDSDSVYHYWKALLALRHEFKDAFLFGIFRLIDEENELVFAYEKRALRNRVIVVLNWSCNTVKWVPPPQTRSAFESSVLLLNNYSRGNINMEDSSIMLAPWEAFIVYEEIGVL
jgi:oligo-1,6-glucosidase